MELGRPNARFLALFSVDLVLLAQVAVGAFAAFECCDQHTLVEVDDQTAQLFDEVGRRGFGDVLVADHHHVQPLLLQHRSDSNRPIQFQLGDAALLHAVNRVVGEVHGWSGGEVSHGWFWGWLLVRVNDVGVDVIIVDRKGSHLSRTTRPIRRRSSSFDRH